MSLGRGTVVFGAGLTAATPSAWAFLGPQLQITGISPFGPLASCGNFPGTVAGAGTSFVGSEVEPWVDVNPSDPLNIVAA